MYSKEEERIRKQLLQFWYLACERYFKEEYLQRDMQIPEGGCKKCPLKMQKQCKALRKKLFGGEQVGENVPRR